MPLFCLQVAIPVSRLLSASSSGTKCPCSSLWFFFIVVIFTFSFYHLLGHFLRESQATSSTASTDVILGIFYSVRRVLLENFCVAQFFTFSMNSASRNFCCFQWLRSLSWWSSLFGEAFVSKVSTALNSFTTLSSFCSTSVSISDMLRSRFILMGDWKNWP